MQSGKLRYKLTLQKPNGETRRGVPVTYIDDRQTWGNIKPMKVTEADKNGQLRVLGQFQITIWNSGVIDETWRIKHGDSIYNITEVVTVGRLDMEMQITATKDKHV